MNSHNSICANLISLQNMCYNSLWSENISKSQSVPLATVFWGSEKNFFITRRTPNSPRVTHCITNNGHWMHNRTRVDLRVFCWFCPYNKHVHEQNLTGIPSSEEWNTIVMYSELYAKAHISSSSFSVSVFISHRPQDRIFTHLSQISIT